MLGGDSLTVDDDVLPIGNQRAFMRRPCCVRDCNGLSGYVTIRSREKMECSECSAKSTEDIDTSVPTARVVMGRHYRSVVIDTCRPECSERAFAELMPFTGAHIIELPRTNRPAKPGDSSLVGWRCLASNSPMHCGVNAFL
jgi:hypothetical protein